MNKLSKTIIGFSIILITGCANSPEFEDKGSATVRQIDVESLNTNALVYGRVQWFENGVERKTEKNTIGLNISPRYLRIEDRGEGSLRIEPDGHFYWELPKGTYLMHQIHWFDPIDGPHRIDPRVAFYVPSVGQALCIGTLKVDIQGKRDLIGGLWIKGRTISVEDECESISLQHVTPDLEKKRLLMVHNHGLPDRPESLENRDQLIDFIRAIMPGLMTIY